VNALWIIIGLGIVGAAVALISSWKSGGGQADLGAVSSQWISEHRLGHDQDSRR
jgi:hypothetical protein